MDWLVEPFELAFQQRALIGGSLAAISLALVGTWVVIQGMSFLGDALVHGMVPGIALAILFGFNVLLGAVVAAVVMILGINLVHRQTTFSEDTGIGLLFVGMLAFGVIIISRSPGYSSDLTSVLFGEVLGVTGGDIVVLLSVLAVTLVASTFFYRPFLVLAFNEDKAQLLGLGPGFTHRVLLGLVTLVIVGSFQTVGTLLVFGLLIGPPATAALLVRRLPWMMAAAAAIAVVSVVVGLVVSYHLNTAGSASIALVPIVMFFVVLAIRNLTSRRRASLARA